MGKMEMMIMLGEFSVLNFIKDMGK